MGCSATRHVLWFKASFLILALYLNHLMFQFPHSYNPSVRCMSLVYGSLPTCTSLTQNSTFKDDLH